MRCRMSAKGQNGHFAVHSRVVPADCRLRLKVEILSLFFCQDVPVVNLWRVHCAPISVRAGYSAAVSEILF
jgi:hypothetical protein